jgi:membrane protein implicated in regulation of membrane protease activity
MSIVYWLMRFFYGLHASGTVDYAVAIGNTARVDLPIPAGRNGSGQIEILLQGQLRVVSAFNNSEKPIPRNERVKVVGQVDGTTLLVEPLE